MRKKILVRTAVFVIALCAVSMAAPADKKDKVEKIPFIDGYYSGEVVNGKPDGYGIYVNEKNKWSYEGGFKNGLFSGKGKVASPEGITSEGIYVLGVMIKGRVNWPNGNYYEGEFKNEKREGKGVYKYSDKVIEGDFKNGEPNGYVKITFKNGEKYEGYVSNDAFNGKGKHTLTDGRYFIGEFKDGKPEGFGTLYAPNGEVLARGLWKGPNLIKPQ